MRLVRLAAAALLVGASTAQAEEADDVASFYRGRTLELLVSTGAGAGYDAYARAMAAHMPDHLPGHPLIVARQLEGAGGLVATNHIANLAPRDGSTFAIVNNPIPYLPLLGETKARYDARALTWLGSAAGETALLVAWRGSGIATLEDARAKGMTVAATGAGSGSYFYARLLNRFLGTKLKIVSGYQSSNQGLLAMERGEVDGFPDLMWSTLQRAKPDWLRDDKVNVIVQLGLKAHPNLPDVPVAVDAVQSDADKRALELALAPLAGARPFVAPPGVPPARIAALRKAFVDTLADPAFRSDLDQQRLDLYDAMDGAALAALIARMYETPAPMVASVAALMNE